MKDEVANSDPEAAIQPGRLLGIVPAAILRRAVLKEQEVRQFVGTDWQLEHATWRWFGEPPVPPSPPPTCSRGSRSVSE